METRGNNGGLSRSFKPVVRYGLVYILKRMDVKWIKGGETRVLDAVFTGC